jgi:type VI secretion system protein ImpE
VLDTDPRIGPNLEVYIAGSYTWIPFFHLRKVEISRPTNLRDLMWLTARIQTSPEFQVQELGEVFLPAISPLSSKHPDESVQLGRETAWEEESVYGALPFGTKILSIDGTDVPLVNIRSLEWPSGAEEPNHATA